MITLSKLLLGAFVVTAVALLWVYSIARNAGQSARDSY
jgi:hypothetical protein